MSGSLLYNFAGVADVGSGISGDSKTLQEIVETLHADCKSADWWGGQAREMFDEFELQWNAQISNLNSALDRMGAETVNAGENMHAVDKQCANYFA